MGGKKKKRNYGELKKKEWGKDDKRQFFRKHSQTVT